MPSACRPVGDPLMPQQRNLKSIETRVEMGSDLKGADLSDLDLREASLSGANLAYANLE
ncbi:MAG: pentapeptide repeat-containing protein, partial [Gammaproteobacteria bacterium]